MMTAWIPNDINGIIHRVRPVVWDPGSKREALLVAGFDGVSHYRASGAGRT